jgi:hypothetical protein
MTRASGKSIEQYTPTGEFVMRYNSISDAGRQSGVKKSNIQRSLSTKHATAGGFIWKYTSSSTINQSKDS